MPTGLKRIVDAKAQFRSLDEPWTDTGTSTGRLMIAVVAVGVHSEGFFNGGSE